MTNAIEQRKNTATTITTPSTNYKKKWSRFDFCTKAAAFDCAAYTHTHISIRSNEKTETQDKKLE